MTIKRVRYRETQTLRSSDLQDEQAYRIGMRRRHHIAHHQWGIVNGLELVERGKAIVVRPGMAVDGYGRDLIVPESLIIDAAVIARWVGEWPRLTLDVYLCYHLESPDDPGCDPQRSGNLSSEEAWLRLECGDPDAPVNPCVPPDVPKTDLDFSADDPPMTDPEQEWPVYLGRIDVSWDTDYEPALLRMQTVPAELRYARLIGAQIQAPWSDPEPWMSVSSEETAGRRRFAVTLPDQKGEAVDRLILDRGGNAEFQGDLTINKIGADGLEADGDLALIGSALEPPLDIRDSGTGLALEPVASMPEAAMPWHLYRAKDTATAMEQLRFEILNPGEDGDPSRQEWSIGFTKPYDAGNARSTRDTMQFKPVLTARADGTVILNSGLIVMGQLIEGIIPADIDDCRFRDELLSRYNRGLTLSGNEVDAFYKSTFEMRTPVVVGTLTVEVEVFFINNNAGENPREILISTLELEVRDSRQRVVHFEKKTQLPDPDPGAQCASPGSQSNPVRPGDTLCTKFRFSVNETDTYTLIARIKSSGASRSVLEQTTSQVVRV